MTYRLRQSVCRFVVLLVAVLTAILTLVAGTVGAANAVTGTASGTLTTAGHTASELTGPAAETRVGASTVAVGSFVGAADVIAAGQRRGNPSPQPVFVSATSVAAETGEAAAGAVSKGVPKTSPNFKPPTNAPKLPPTEIPPGWRVRQMPPSPHYPNGYWRLEKPMGNGGWQGINPSTGKPGPQPDTHVPFPGGG